MFKVVTDLLVCLQADNLSAWPHFFQEFLSWHLICCLYFREAGRGFWEQVPLCHALQLLWWKKLSSLSNMGPSLSPQSWRFKLHFHFFCILPAFQTTNVTGQPKKAKRQQSGMHVTDVCTKHRVLLSQQEGLGAVCHCYSCRAVPQ